MQNAVDGIFVEDAEISVRMEIHFQGLQLQTLLVRHVVQRDGAEIRQAGLWADCGIFRDLDGDFVPLVLVLECFDIRQWSGSAARRVVFIVAKLYALRFSSCCFTFHVSCLTSF